MPDPSEDAEPEESPPEPAPEEGVLSPDELDIESRRGVKRRGDDQYVISIDNATGEGPTSSVIDRSTPATDATPPERTPPDTQDRQRETDPGAATKAALAAQDTTYGVVMAVTTDRGMAHTELGSNNIVETFEATLRWYAERIDETLPPEEVVQLLLEQSALDLE